MVLSLRIYLLAQKSLSWRKPDELKRDGNRHFLPPQSKRHFLPPQGKMLMKVLFMLAQTL